MKTLKMAAFAGLMAFATASPDTAQADTRVYLRIAPPKPRVVNVINVRKPQRDAIWVKGHWRWNGRRHVWVNGKWMRPKRGFVYVPGHWRHNRHGWFFVKGRWKRI